MKVLIERTGIGRWIKIQGTGSKEGETVRPMGCGWVDLFGVAQEGEGW
jgi:hypothetical protein